MIASRAALTIPASLGLTGAGKISEIATVKGSQLRGSGTDCTRFTEPVAEGG